MTTAGCTLVTGGGGGIGAGIARVLAQSGEHPVAICDLSLEAARKVSDSIRNARAYELDVSDPSAVARIFDQVEDELGPVRGCVLAAGIAVKKSALDYTPEDWRQTLAVNLDGSFWPAQAAARRMAASQIPGASIVAISSICGSIADAMSRHVAYEASKGGVNLMVKALATELAPLGIRINAVAPGRIETPLLNPDPAHRRRVAERIPMGRYGTVEDVAELVRFLLSVEAGYITGAVLPVDGGWTAW